MILNEVMKEIADAIREKTGKSDLIAPINFAEEIKGITAGGGDAPSGVRSSWRYFDVSKLTLDIKLFAPYMFIMRVVISTYGDMISGTTGVYTAALEPNEIKAVGYDAKSLYGVSNNIQTLGEYLEAQGVISAMVGNGAVEITEAEFLTKTFE